jgi:dipeptidyl aminopeptidase/acylaminoacyl peptidase
LAAVAALAAGFILAPLAMLAQEKPLVTIEQDCRTFAIAPDNRIVYAVPRMKRIKKLIIERDEIWIASPKGGQKQIVDVNKFMPVPPPSSYMVDSLAWSPDGQRIAVNMTTQKPASVDEPASGGKAVALLDDKGGEIKVQGLSTRFIENASHATWLADGATVVYTTPTRPYQIFRVNPAKGGARALFEGSTFEAVAWDAERNQAFAVSENLSIHGRQTLVQLDLVHETVKEIARMDAYQGELIVSPSGKKIAYFSDGDVLEVIDLADPSRPVHRPAGVGEIVWGPDERRVLLKRGPDEETGDIVWVGIYDGSFVPALHGLGYHAFEIAPDGETIAVTEPGKNVLKLYPLR